MPRTRLLLFAATLVLAAACREDDSKVNFVPVTHDDAGDPGSDAGSSADSSPPPPPPDAAPPATPPPMTSAVTIIVEPGDNFAGITSAIQGAKSSVHMGMYILSN